MYFENALEDHQLYHSNAEGLFSPRGPAGADPGAKGAACAAKAPCLLSDWLNQISEELRHHICSGKYLKAPGTNFGSSSFSHTSVCS